MSVATASTRSPEPFHQDRIILFGGSSRTLDILRLATIRSDNVILVESEPTTQTRTYARRFAVDHRTDASLDVLGRADTVLIAMGDMDAENDVLRKARALDIPTHVVERPLVSDFSLLEFLEGRSSSRKASLVE